MNGTTLIRNPGIESLLEVLHQERRVLERLMFRLSEAQLLVGAHQDRYLAFASDDVEDIEYQLGEVEMLRSILVGGLAETWELSEHELTLSAIIDRAGPDHKTLLRRELDALRDLVGEIDELKNAIANTSLKRLEDTQRAMTRLTNGPPDGYGRDGSPWSPAASPPGFATEL